MFAAIWSTWMKYNLVDLVKHGKVSCCQVCSPFARYTFTQQYVHVHQATQKLKNNKSIWALLLCFYYAISIFCRFCISITRFLENVKRIFTCCKAVISLLRNNHCALTALRETHTAKIYLGFLGRPIFQCMLLSYAAAAGGRPNGYFMKILWFLFWIRFLFCMPYDETLLYNISLCWKVEAEDRWKRKMI